MVDDDKKPTYEELEAENKKLKEQLDDLEIKWFIQDGQVRFFGDRLGEPCLVIRRDYKQFYGRLLGARFDLTELTVELEQTYNDYDSKQKIREVRLAKIPKSALLDIEFIQDKQTKPMEDY